MKNFLLKFIFCLLLFLSSQEVWAAGGNCEKQFISLKTIFSRDEKGVVQAQVSDQAKETASGVYLDEYIRNNPPLSGQQLAIIEMAHQLGAEEAQETGFYRREDKIVKNQFLMEARLTPRMRQNILSIITSSGSESYRPFALIKTLFFRRLGSEDPIHLLTLEARNSIQGIRLERYLKDLFLQQKITEEKLKAIEKAHKVGSKKAHEQGSYSAKDREEKFRILTSVDFSESEAQTIVDIIT